VASIRCGNCRGTHESTAEIRACYAAPPAEVIPMATERQVGYLQSLLDSRVKSDLLPDDLDPTTLTKREASEAIDILLKQAYKPKRGWIPDDLPDGRYAILHPETQQPYFYRVATGKESGKRRCQRMVGAPGDFRYLSIRESEIKAVMDMIKQDPATHSQMFGILVGACGVCGSPLTDPDSIERGIGPICARKMEW
jgi:Family of unknown function (DUF6011)